MRARDAAHDARCETCGARFAQAQSARRHAREQRHRVVIVETVDHAREARHP
ncbi:MAG: hypothetical protein U0667_15420 [Chloroflexota bacterium]